MSSLLWQAPQTVRLLYLLVTSSVRLTECTRCASLSAPSDWHRLNDHMCPYICNTMCSCVTTPYTDNHTRVWVCLPYDTHSHLESNDTQRRCSLWLGSIAYYNAHFYGTFHGLRGKYPPVCVILWPRDRLQSLSVQTRVLLWVDGSQKYIFYIIKSGTQPVAATPSTWGLLSSSASLHWFNSSLILSDHIPSASETDQELVEI